MPRSFSLSICLTLTLLFSFATPRPVTAAEVANGDSLEQVKMKLGNPKGVFKKGEGEVLLYDRGSVEVYEGYVVRHDLVSKQEAAARLKKDRANAARQAEDAKAKRQAQQAEGEAERKRTLKDEAFAEKSAAEQVAYWQNFQRRYPGVIVADQLQSARKKQEEERAASEKAAEEQRLADEAAAPPPPILSSRKKRKARRSAGRDPDKKVETAPYTPDYRPLGGNLAP